MTVLAETGSRYLDDKGVLPDVSSDLDVAIAFETHPVDTIGAYGILFKEISEIFDPFSIDLIFMHEVSPLFQYEIIKGIRIYERDEFSADEFEERIMKMAEDLSFKKKIFDNDVMEAIENGYFEFEYSPNP
jgi:predicted nucleotidyltransferase